MRLDHMIATVPDIAVTHRRLLDLGFGEAWPPGPFWPGALTSGVALGGANLELYQPLEGTVRPKIETIVLAPDDLSEGRSFLEDLGLPYEIFEKVEEDPELLALRGFPPELCAAPQAICTNLLPHNPPYPFFLCVYAPFLKARLAPERFPAPQGPMVAVRLLSPNPETVRPLAESLYMDVERGAISQVSEIRFALGGSLTAEDL